MYEALLEPVRMRLVAAGVRRLGIFGSYARNEARADSDVDVLVSFEPKQRTFENLYEVGETLEEVFQRKVDLVTEDSLSPHIGPHILREVQYINLGR
jgi:predicted nucleotidyltransferase